jgi:arylsulfatase A-like enzyme
MIGSYFNDPIAYRSYDDFLFRDSNPQGSLVFGLLARLLFRRQYFNTPISDYPEGLPRAGFTPIFFELAKVFDGLAETIASLPQPYFAYFHLWAPHSPFKPTKAFADKFNDNWRPQRKPEHPLGAKVRQSYLETRRRNYDEYIANVDFEFGRLIDRLDAQGVLDKSYFIVTSDHGEMSERGEDGHVTPLLYDPVVHVPLMISAPGQRTRKDIFSSTNSVDVLPTLLHATGREIPDWCEGAVLPGFGGADDPERSTFSVDAKTDRAYTALTKATVAMRKGQYKIIYYTGYSKGKETFELYDWQDDPDELRDLYKGKRPAIAKRLKDELLTRFNEMNQKYQKQ